MHRFAEFAESQRLEGSKMRMADVEGMEIVVKGFRTAASKCDPKERCMTLQFEMDGDTHVVFTGSTVLMEQAERYKDKMPFLATIQKIGRYYTFT